MMKKLISIFLVLLLPLMGMASAVSYTAISAVSSLDTLNDYAAAPGAWTTLQTNGSINYYAWPAGYDVLLGVNVTNTTNATCDYLTILPGTASGGAFRSSIGNMTYNSLGTKVYWFGPLESARFQNATGYLQVTAGYYAGEVAIIKVRR